MCEVKDQKSTSCTDLVLILLQWGEIHIFSSDALVDVQDILRGGLEMAGSVIRSGNEDLVLGSVISWLQLVRDRDELLLDWSQKRQSEGALLKWVISLHLGRDNSHELTLWNDEKLGGDTHDVDIISSLDLTLWQDDLAGVLSVGAWNWVVEDTDDSGDLSDLSYLIWEVRWISDDELALGNLSLGLDSNDLSVRSVDDLVDRLVKHIGSSVDSGQTGESLWKLSESITWVDERRSSSVLVEGVTVELDLADGFNSWALQVVIIGVESTGMSDEGLGVIIESKLLVELRHRLTVDIEVVVGLWLIGLPSSNIVSEISASSLLKDSHQSRSHDLSSGGWDTMDLLIFVDVRVGDGLELEIASDSSLEEELDHKSRCHQELWYEIDVVVAGLSQSWVWLLSWEELLENLIKVKGSAVSSIVVVAVNVEDLLSLDGENSGDDALLQSSSDNDAVVFLIHSCCSC
jgi:hypothetical protein